MLIKYILFLGLFCYLITNSLAQAPLSGPVAGTLTKANSPYLITGSITIPTGQTLTIESGVEIRSASPYDQIAVYGTLLAQGMVSDSIRFTGFANPAYGSSHGGQLNFASGSVNSVLSYVVIDQWADTYPYARGNRPAVNVSTGVSSLTISNSSIRNSKGRGITISSSGVSMSDCSVSYSGEVGISIDMVSISPVISSVAFSGNGNAIVAYASSVSGLSNLTNADIQLRGGPTETSCSIPKAGPGSYYNLAESGFSISANTVTTIEPGAEIRSPSATDQIVVNGTLLAQGTASDSIRFVGLANLPNGTTHGGRLIFANGSVNSVLSYVTIDYWAQTYQYGPNRAAIEVNSGVSALSISNSSIRNSQGRGMHISSSGVSVSNCRVSNNGTIGINIDVVSISPVINSVVFSGNGNAMMAFASSVGGLSNLTNADIQLRGGST
ncbi:right-handed parallel beta-helix repeat-containing protein [Spirosoma migulaei]